MKQTIDKSALYERCINLAMRLLEKEWRNNGGIYAGQSLYMENKYSKKEVIELADELYKKIKAAK